MSKIFLSERKWPITPDVRRLDNAFEQLAAQGVLTIHNGPCCDSCIGAYIWNEVIPAAKQVNRTFVGYAFYNEQTSESVTEGNDLFLTCGPIPEPEDKSAYREAAERIIFLVKRELETAGLKPQVAAHAHDVLRLPINFTVSAA